MKTCNAILIVFISPKFIESQTRSIFTIKNNQYPDFIKIFLISSFKYTVEKQTIKSQMTEIIFNSHNP